MTGLAIPQSERLRCNTKRQKAPDGAGAFESTKGTPRAQMVTQKAEGAYAVRHRSNSPPRAPASAGLFVSEPDPFWPRQAGSRETPPTRRCRIDGPGLGTTRG